MGSKIGGAENRGDGRRLQRVEREIREVVGSYLLTGFRGDLPGLLSVTRVIASKDMRQAKILVTMMVPGDGAKIDQKQVVRELQAHAYEIQGEVNHKLRMKHCPRLTFFYDDGFENALKVENILRDISRATVKVAAVPASDTSKDS